MTPPDARSAFIALVAGALLVGAAVGAILLWSVMP